MNNKNIFIVILVVGLVICISLAGITIYSNLEIRTELTKTENDLSIMNTNLQENITILIEKTGELKASDSFLKSYLIGLGTYYNASELYDEAGVRYNKASEKYESGYWSSASTWYENSMRWYSDTGLKYREARDIFKEAAKNTSNTTCQNICLLYVDMMNTSSIAVTYLYEASEFYKSSCEFYLIGDYNEAHESKNNAEKKLTYYNEKMNKFDEYQEELQNTLIGIS